MNKFNHFFNEAVNIREEEDFDDLHIAYSDYIDRVRQELPTQIGHKIKHEAKKAEANGRFGIVRGPELELYFAVADYGPIKTPPVHKQVNKGKEFIPGPDGNPTIAKTRGSDVLVAEEDVQGNMIAYAIPDSDIEWIENHFSGDPDRTV
tara:strand:+ start:41 stop:487 length:447 start_codon:yes stop_codon:yes gene_type:complete